MNSKVLIGLTGTYCAGKNYVARFLEERGLSVLDVDKLGHEALEAEKTAVTARFGPDILDAKGAVDRRLLGNKVFGKPEELSALENIVHPAANRLTEAWIARQNGTCVINAALLHRSSIFKRLDFIILVRAPFLARLLRARRRDGLSLGRLIRRFKSQKEFTSQYLTRKADIYTVDNPGYCGFCSSLYRGRLENRLNAILSRKGTL
jgi:dephospho-CoA kinase